jgi:hypothetical protein
MGPVSAGARAGGLPPPFVVTNGRTRRLRKPALDGNRRAIHANSGLSLRLDFTSVSSRQFRRAISTGSRPSR